MTEFDTSDRDVSRAIRSWLHEDRHEDVSRVAGAVLDQVDAIPQRRATRWPVRRTPTMNRFITFGVGAAAVVAVLLIGAQLLGSRGLNPGSGPTSTTRPTATPEPTPVGLLPVNHRHELWDNVRIQVLIAAPGWYGEPDEGVLTKNDNPNAPDGAQVMVFAQADEFGMPGEGDLYVYGDPCHWKSSKPQKPVTTVDQAVAALSSQASRDAEPATEVTYDGYAGKYLTLHVSSDAVFTDCDDGQFRTLVDGGNARISDDPGQNDLLTVLDVNGELVIFDVAYFDGTPDSALDEAAGIVTSMRLGSH